MRQTIASPQVIELKQLIIAYCRKPGNRIGGNLQIVLGTGGNVQEVHIQQSRQWALDHGDKDAVVILDKLLQISSSKRYSLVRCWYNDH